MSNNIYKKLNEFKKIVSKVKKDGLNPHFKNKYATIESVLETIEEPLEKAGLGFYQIVKEMTLETILYDTESDDKLISSVPLIISKSDMQQLGSALTYARRYGLVALLGLEQEDDDGNLAVSNNVNNSSGVNNKPQYNNTQQNYNNTKTYNAEKRKPTAEEVLELEELIIKAKKDKAKLLYFFKVEKLEDVGDYSYCKNILLKQIKKNEEEQKKLEQEEADSKVPF